MFALILSISSGVTRSCETYPKEISPVYKRIFQRNKVDMA